MFVSRYGSINEYTLSTSFDTSTASKTTAAWWSSNNSYGISNYGSSYSITGMQYNNDGTKLFTVHQRSTVGHTAKIVEWSLSTAYDPMTASTNADFNDTSTYFETGEATSSAGNGIPTQFITFNNDGTKFFSFNHTHETGSSSSQKIKEWNLASPFNLVNVSGEHSGDVINTSSTDNYDTDPDGDTLTVTTYSHTSATDEDGGSISSTSSTGTAGTNNVTGYYGTLDLEGDGSYTYTADLTATQALDPGDTVTDVFTYTVDDGNGETDTATITITVNGMNDAPTAVADTDSVDAGSTVTDTTNGAGTLVSNDTDPDASSSLYVTKITGNGNTSNVTYNSTKISNAATIVGSKGTLTFGSDGSYSYAANSDATSGDDVFTYTLTDGTSTSTATLTISVTEVANNAPTITAQTDVAGAVTEITDGASGEGTNNLTDTGSFTIADLDNDSVSVSTAEGTTDAVGGSFLGALTATVADDTDDGSGQINWTYTVADADVEYLEAGETVTETFTVTVSDGNGGTVDQTVTVVITGANDAPTLTTGAVDVAVNEASDASAQDLSSSGTITFADLDETTSITAATSTVTGSSGVSIPSAVNTALLSAITVTDNSDNTAGWTLSATDLDLDFLTAGQTITLEKVVTATDGQSATVTDTITVTITGTNDAPTLTTGAVDVAVNEASDASAQDLSSSGTITFADLDETTSITAATSTVTGSSGVSIPSAVNTALLSAITVTDNSDNTAGWTLSATDLDLDFLTAGQTITLEKVVTATDGQSATVTDTITVTITGTNDAPTLTTGAVDVAVNEASDASAQDLSSSGTITFADLDETTSITAATSTVTGSSGVSIPSAVNTALLSAITVTDNSDNTAGWTLSATDLDLDFLTAGQTITLEKVVTATDGQSATVTDTITVTITGTNDAPTLTTGAVDVDVNEASDASAQDLSSSGTITFADLDETTSITAATSTVTGSSGVSIPSAVNTALLSAITVTDNSDNTAGWTLSATDLDLDFLTAGQTITLEKVVTATDGQSATVTDTITVTITGTNDAPTLTTGAVDVAVNEASDASAQDLSSSGTITFADLDETTSITAATSTVTGSSGVSIPSAVNTALLSAITVTDNSDNTAGWTLSATDLDLDFLTAGQTITLEKVVTATDGQSATVTDTITVTITGTNDAPTLTTGAVDVAVNEASDASAQDLSSSGTITFADLDETTSITAATSTVTGSSGVSIPSAVNTALLSAITVTDNSDNTAGWTLSATDLDLDFLTAGQTITLEKVVTATDGQSATVTDTITVTITGTNDAPTLTTGAVDVAVNEASDASAQDLSSSGTITFADLDETTSITAATSTVTGSSGVSIPSAVNTALLSAITVTDNSDNTAGWTLSATDLDLDFLTAGQTITLEKVVTATDGQSATVTDTITVTITGTNDAPTLTTGAVDVDVNEASDASAQDLSSSGTITFADLDETTSITAATSTVTGSSGVSIPSAVNTALLSAITVTDNSDNTAGWTLSATDLDLDFLTAGQTITLEKVVTATDGQSATVTDTITVTITGTNDAPTITAQTDVAGAVTEITDGASGEGTNNLTDTGSFTIADLDNDSVSVSTAEGTTDAVGGSFLGALTATVADDTDDGSGQINWTYTVADADVEYLEAGETVTETFTVTVSDGNGGTVDQTVTVVITGANDTPTLTTGAVDVAVNEASDASAQDLSSSGTITFADLDETTSITAATSTVTGSSGVSIPSAVNTALLSAITVTDNSDNTAGWTLSATDLDLDFLTAGQTITLEKVVTATDGQSATVTDTITVTITGTNDTPTLTTGAVDVAVNEASDASAQDLSSSGTITFADLDETTSITAATSTVTGSSGVSIPSAVNTALLSAITVTDNSDNTAGWTLSATDLDLDFLTAGQTITLEKVVTATDGQSATVTDTITVTITGTNDTPTLTTGAVDVAVNEASDASAQDLSSSGTITFADLDETTSITAATSTVTGSSGVSIPSAVNTALLSAITVTDNSDNTAGWTLSATDLDLDFLTAGQTITLEKVVTATDGQSATVTDTITVTITGTNDAPTLTTGAVDVAVNEASDASAQDLSSSGTITFADLDETTSITAATSTVTGSSGVSIPSAVNTALLSAITVTDNSDNTAGWTLSATDLDLDFLTAGQTITLEKVVTATDGQSATVTDTITVTITGTNDTPTLTTGAVDVAVNEASDASAQDLSSSGTITFADLDETTSITAATSTVTGSSGVSIPSAVNTALLSAITVTDNSDNTAGWTLSATDLDLDFLTAGQTITLEKVVTATDGQSATVTDTITVTITGTNDTPTLTTGAVDVAVNEASDASAQDLSSSGTITFADLDETTSITAATSTVTGSSGVSIPSAVNTALLSAITVTDNSDNTAGWTLSATDLDLDFLTAGQTITLEKVVTATDGQSATVTDTITVTITGTNDAPVANVDTISVAAGTPATGNVVTANDTDPDGDSLTVSAIAEGDVDSPITGTYGTFTLNSDGSYTYTVDTLNADVIAWKPGDAVLTETFTYTVSDGNGGTNDATITVNASGQNDAPTAADNAVTTDEDTDHTFDASEFGFTDVDSDSLDHVTIETLPSKGTLLLDGSAVSAGDEIAAADIASLVFRPAADGNGDDYDSFTFSVNDGTVDSGSYTMTVNVDAVNDAPTAADNAVTTNEDTDHTFSASEFGFTDVDSDSLDHVTIETLPSEGTLLLDGSAVSEGDEIAAADIANLVFRPAANENGDDYDSFTFSVNDGTVDSASTYTMTVNVTPVNDVPTITATTENDFTEGSTSADDTVSVFNIGDTETSDSNLELSISNTTYYSITNNNDGTATVTLTSDGADYVNAGNDLPSYTVTVTDESNATATATHDPTVTPTDDTPTITATTENDFTEGSTSTGDTVAVFDVDDEETADGSLVVTIISGNDNGYYEISYDNAGTATVTLTSAGADYVNAGNDLPEYTVQVSDGSLNATTSHNPTTLENTKPEASNNTITTLEDTSYTFSSNDFGFTDDDGNTLSSVTVSSLGTNGNGTFTLNGVAISGSTTVTKAQIDNGLLKFTPSSGDNGSSYNTYTFTVNDGTDDSSSSYTMTINVTAVNDAPVATDDESSVSEDSTVRVRKNGDDLLNDDSDPENDSLKVTLIKVLGGSNNSISNGSSTTITGTYGQLTVNSNGGYTYRANQNAADALDTGESAEEKFVYTVSDGNGGTDTGILTITINGVEDNPNAIKDNVSLNISESLTHTGNAITNDIDPDDSLTIVGCGQGRNPNNGTAKTVGTAFNSNYGQMTINADGTYTFVAARNIKELLDPGQSVTERFYYTISDGNSTSTAMIEVTVQRDNVVNELPKKEKKQIQKRITQDRTNQQSTIILEDTSSASSKIEQTLNTFDNINNTKKLSFNEGIKLVDLVAETGSLQTTDGSLDKVRAKEKDGQLNLSFKVSTDLGNQIVKYEGVMPDGSKLPDWIKVDPQTGKTTTNIPEGVELVDFIIVTTDQQNNRKEIAVSIDPKEIKADKEIFKQAKKQNASLSVDQSGNVNIIQKDESGNVNKTETRNLNANEKQNLNNNITTQDLNLDNTNDIKNIIETIKSDQIYQLQTITNGEGFEIKVPDSIIGSFEKTKLVLKDGSVLPDWVQFNPITGEINANPPEDVDKLEFKLIIERDGEIIVKDLAVDVGGDDNAQILDDIENAKFIAFKDQLNKEHENWEEYGSNIINRL